MIASFLLSCGYIFNLKCDKILDTERGKNMNDIFTQQPDIVTAGTDFVISLMAAVFGYMTVRRHTDRNAVCNMSILMFAAVFAAGIAGAVLHGLTAVSESFAAEQVIRSFTAACLGGIAVPVVYGISSFSYIDPACAAGRFFQFRNRQFNAGIGSPACRKYGIHTFKRFVQINLHIFIDSERTYASGRMSDDLFTFLQLDHFSFGCKSMFELRVIDSRVTDC